MLLLTIFQAWVMEAKWLFCILGCITSSYWLGLFYTCFHQPGLSFHGCAVTTAGTQVPNIQDLWHVLSFLCSSQHLIYLFFHGRYLFRAWPQQNVSTATVQEFHIFSRRVLGVGISWKKSLGPHFGVCYSLNVVTGEEYWGCQMGLRRLEVFVGTWPSVYFWSGCCVISVSGRKSSLQERYGTIPVLNFNIWLQGNFAPFCTLGGVLYCHISICDFGSVANSRSYITGSQRWSSFLPLPRSISPHWPRGITL